MQEGRTRAVEKNASRKGSSSGQYCMLWFSLCPLQNAFSIQSATCVGLLTKLRPIARFDLLAAIATSDTDCFATRFDQFVRTSCWFGS